MDWLPYVCTNGGLLLRDALVLRCVSREFRSIVNEWFAVIVRKDRDTELVELARYGTGDDYVDIVEEMLAGATAKKSGKVLDHPEMGGNLRMNGIFLREFFKCYRGNWKMMLAIGTFMVLKYMDHRVPNIIVQGFRIAFVIQYFRRWIEACVKENPKIWELPFVGAMVEYHFAGFEEMGRFCRLFQHSVVFPVNVLGDMMQGVRYMRAFVKSVKNRREVYLGGHGGVYWLKEGGRRRYL